MTDWLEPIKTQVEAMLANTTDPDRRSTLQRLLIYLERVDDAKFNRRDHMRNYMREYRQRKRSNL